MSVLLPPLLLVLAIVGWVPVIAHPIYQYAHGSGGCNPVAHCQRSDGGHRTFIPNGANVPNWPGVGHTNPQGGGPRNSFGTRYRRPPRLSL